MLFSACCIWLSKDTKLEEDIAPRLLYMKNMIESNLYIS
ncbi:Transcriptional regulator, IclR family [Psychrobacter aquaticus CMS 56]|uniref:Transcriptional regulator, IclR family n=1 Tax=Psychrobacter aquaticus CMS 56 TaxID=1354303 RepID=U4T9N6_9GAMM|nr:Transcriptional regulator, IclR family [Psychrobacter aquaticus CMS 56]